jgi:hypothetical protein
MSAGVKQYKPSLSLGNKTYKPSLSLGVKTYLPTVANKGPTNSNVSGHSHNGIDNTSNSADVQREPMKYNHFQTKSYISNKTEHKPMIEKAKRKTHEKKDNKFV